MAPKNKKHFKTTKTCTKHVFMTSQVLVVIVEYFYSVCSGITVGKPIFVVFSKVVN